ncbi:MAG TPA: type II/IV secretion system ATPase subunit [Candidatus Thermoplasmatota archaeon]|nr:type II/IV secretion system ATPase subunit [Candidatus Thermoplasmatota archaeon]
MSFRLLRGESAATDAPASDRPVLAVPGLTGSREAIEERVLRQGRCVTRLSYDRVEGRYLYEVFEPELSPSETSILAFLRDGLLRSLATRPEDGHGVEEVLLARATDLMRDHDVRLDPGGRERVLYYVVRDFAGYGRIDPLMSDPNIEDISCDGPGIPVFLFHRKHEAMRTTIVFADASELDAFVLLLAQRAGKHVSVAKPLLDATLPDKSRLQTTFGGEVTPRGSSFTIRKFRTDPITPPLLVKLGTMDAEMAAWFWLAIEHGQSALVVGGTASGKTTTLNACSLFIPGERKIVSIEDTRELNLPHDNWISGVTRGAGAQVAALKAEGDVDMYDLLAAALRQRPEYLLVGEVRGREAMTLFQAMATGHATFSTMHADSVAGAIHRLENEPILVPRVMLENLRAMAIQAQVRVGGKLVRRVREVSEIKGIDMAVGEIVTNTVFRWDPATDSFRFSPRSYVLDAIGERLQMTQTRMREELARRADVVRWMVHTGVLNYVDVAKVVQRYTREPDELVARARRETPVVSIARVGG